MGAPEPRVVIRDGQSHVDIVQNGRPIATINVSNLLLSLADAFRKPTRPPKELKP